MKTFILVPVYNEGKAFRDWLPRLMGVAEELSATVVIVEDGSESNFQFPIFNFQSIFKDQFSNLEKIVYLKHMVNCGVGAAIATGMEYAVREGAELVMTIDGDGQHDPEDLKLIYQELLKGRMDIVNGSRFLKKQKIPWLRRVANFFGNKVTFLLSGFWLSDSQSGMKGFSQRALQKLEINSAGYEWCTEVFREANWYGLKVKEVPISVMYNQYTLYKGQCFALGIDMLMRLMMRSLVRKH